MRFESTVLIQHLRRFETDEDGTTTNVVVTDLVGRELTLAFPIEVVSSLMMTLPRMIDRIVKRRGADQRVVYPLDSHTLEVAKDGSTRIMTLRTRDGFEVAFTLNPDSTQSWWNPVDRQIRPLFMSKPATSA